MNPQDSTDKQTFASYPSLQGKVIFITGGATGIGAAMVRTFFSQGAQVAYIDFDEPAALALNTALAQEFGREPWYRTVDVTEVDALQNSIRDAASACGGLHVLINNVANDERHSPLEISPDYWRRCLAVNLDAAFFASQTASPLLAAAGGGAIINIGSINALLGPANMPGYVTAKAGLLGMTRALARELGSRNIRVNTILPGWVVTERQLALWLTPEEEARWLEQVSLKQRILPADVARLALFLAADDSKMITGQEMTIDAGRT
ncbi:MAG: SDR family oxidoreductase [Pseudomonadales bacterium]|nr:SDR family oxidoreductase [Pseudomonadales bacterium]